MALDIFQNYQTQQQRPAAPPPQQSWNRYIPPTFNWGRGGLTGNQPQYTDMQWNQMRGYNLPTQDGRASGPNQYQNWMRDMYRGFEGQYGGPNRRPTVPQFGPYGGGDRPNPRHGRPIVSEAESQRAREYEALRGPTQQGFGDGSYQDYVANYRPEQRDPNMMYTAVVQPGRDVPFSEEEWMAQQGGGRQGGYGDSGGGGMRGGPGGWDMNNPEGYGAGESFTDFGPRNMGHWRGMGRGDYFGGGGGFNPFNPFSFMPRGRGMSREDMLPSWFGDFLGGGFGQSKPNSQGGGEGAVKPEFAGDQSMNKPLVTSGGGPNNTAIGGNIPPWLYGNIYPGGG